MTSGGGDSCRAVIHERTELKAQWGESGVLGASQMLEKDPKSFWFLPRMCPEHSYTDVWSQVPPSKPSFQPLWAYLCPLDWSPTQRTRMSNFGPCTKGISGGPMPRPPWDSGLSMCSLRLLSAPPIGGPVCVGVQYTPTSCQNRSVRQKRRRPLSSLVGGPGPLCPALSALLSLWHDLYFQPSPLKPGLTLESPGEKWPEGPARLGFGPCSYGLKVVLGQGSGFWSLLGWNSLHCSEHCFCSLTSLALQHRTSHCRWPQL